MMFFYLGLEFVVVGVEFESLLPVLDSLVMLAYGFKYVAVVVVEFGGGGFLAFRDFDSLGLKFTGLVIFSLFVENPRESVEAS